MNFWAVLVAAVAAFVLSGAWYAGFGKQLARLSPAYTGEGRSPAVTAVVEIVRNLVLALVVAGLTMFVDIGGWTDAVLLAGAVWIGFPVMILTGSVFHEKVPAKLAAIHAGDWLIKLLAVTLIVGLWR
ncbi:DUF1761 domain-containing protein [Stackebrandtia nassauensis]|nr:DUF1761 domain-containing protein [Stackebrandtia nassauensis]